MDLPLILPPGVAPARELFLALPGLNFHPGRLSPWHELLAGQGSAVLVPALTGYAFPGDPEQKKVTAARYMADLDMAWAGAAAQLPGAACSILGYSLGGVLGLVWVLQQKIPLKRALLISPALRLKPWVRFLIAGLGRVLPHRLGLPSLAPADYRLHPTTTIGAYWAVLALERQLSAALTGWIGNGGEGVLGKDRIGGSDAPPRLLIVFAEKDEFINTRVFHRLHAAFPERVSLHRLDHSARRGYPLHLGLDAATLGEGEWSRLKGAVTAWLAATSGEAGQHQRPEVKPPPPDANPLSNGKPP